MNLCTSVIEERGIGEGVDSEVLSEALLVIHTEIRQSSDDRCVCVLA